MRVTNEQSMEFFILASSCGLNPHEKLVLNMQISVCINLSEKYPYIDFHRIIECEIKEAASAKAMGGAA